MPTTLTHDNAVLQTLPDFPVTSFDAARPDFELLVAQAQVGIFVIQDGRIRWANPKLAEIFGYASAGMLRELRYANHVHPDDLERVQDMVRRRMAGQYHTAYDCRCVRVDGSVFDARLFGRVISWQGQPADLGTLSDISEVKQAMRTAQWHAQMLARTELLCRSGSAEIDLQRRQVRISAGLRVLTGDGSGSQQVALWRCLRAIPADERSHVLAKWRQARPGIPFEFKHRLLRADGTPLQVLHRGVIEADTPGDAPRGVAMLQDVTAQAEAQQQIQQLANYHPVTGLPNRSLLLQRLREALVVARQECRQAAVLYLSITQLARVEETMGFSTGAAAAVALAQRLGSLCAEGDTLAHVGAHDFALLLGGTGAIEGSVSTRATAIVAALKEPVTVGTTEFFLHGRVGIALFPDDADASEQLLENAHSACCLSATDAAVGHFSWQTGQRALRRMNIETALHRALRDDSFQLYYQPQVDLRDGSVVGVEALLRWRCPQLGDVAPVELVQIAEECGLFGAIGEWVMRAACRQSVAWAQAGLPPVRIAINVSPKQLRHTKVSWRLQAIIHETGADPAHLGIEVTENMLCDDLEHARRTLRELRAIGIEITIDDVGIGNSNLSVLRSLPFDVLKIDRSLVNDVTARPEDVSIARGMLSMAHSLHLKVLAEGVETEGQLNLLAANGCDLIQGFLFSQPLPPEAIATMLLEDRRLPERFHLRRQRKRTLLLVDDEGGVLSSLQRLLRPDGYRIVSAANGPEGLLRLAEQDIDVIISDQRMPGMTGVDFLRQAKELYPDTVRLVLSGYTDLQSITDAVNEGAIYKFLTKPWDGVRLRAHVQEAFRRKEMSDDNRRLAQEVQTANEELALANDRLERLLDRQKERAMLEESRAANAQHILQSMPAAVVGVDVHGMIAFVNQRARQLLGRDAGAVGSDARETLPPGLRDVWRRPSGEHTTAELACGRCRVVCSDMGAAQSVQGHLIVITPDTDIPMLETTA